MTRVGLITYGLDRPLTGIGRYTVELTRAFNHPNNAYDISLLTAGQPSALGNENVFASRPLTGCKYLPALITYGNLIISRISQQKELELVHDPNGVAPFFSIAGKIKTVVTIHDVFVWSCPGNSALLDILIYRYLLPRITKRVDAVITVSEHSRRNIQKYLDVPLKKIHVIPYGVSPKFRVMDSDDVKIHLKNRLNISFPYILFVGALTLRKNIESALEAFALIQGQFPELRFVLAGPRTSKNTPTDMLVERLNLQNCVHLTGPLTDVDLPALYNGAELFVFPSLCEGFGLPPLEALACGTPVICSNATALPEVVGDAAITVDPLDVDKIANAMRNLLENTDLRGEYKERGLLRAKKFSWERTARETLSVYEKVLNTSSTNPNLA